jgi:hypothetical protein
MQIVRPTMIAGVAALVVTAVQVVTPPPGEVSWWAPLALLAGGGLVGLSLRTFRKPPPLIVAGLFVLAWAEFRLVEAAIAAWWPGAEEPIEGSIQFVEPDSGSEQLVAVAPADHRFGVAAWIVLGLVLIVAGWWWAGGRSGGILRRSSRPT